MKTPKPKSSILTCPPHLRARAVCAGFLNKGERTGAFWEDVKGRGQNRTCRQLSREVVASAAPRVNLLCVMGRVTAGRVAIPPKEREI